MSEQEFEDLQVILDYLEPTSDLYNSLLKAINKLKKHDQ